MLHGREIWVRLVGRVEIYEAQTACEDNSSSCVEVQGTLSSVVRQPERGPIRSSLSSAKVKRSLSRTFTPTCFYLFWYLIKPWNKCTLFCFCYHLSQIVILKQMGHCAVDHTVRNSRNGEDCNFCREWLVYRSFLVHSSQLPKLHRLCGIKRITVNYELS